MRAVTFFHYIRQDLLHRRGREEVMMGFIAILFAAATLQIMLSIATSVNSMVERSLEKARPVLGVIDVRPRYKGLLTTEQVEFLKQLPQTETATGKIAAASLIVEGMAQDFNIWRQDKSQALLMVSSLAVPYGDAMLDPKYGMTYFGTGKPFKDKPTTWDFEVIVNSRFLGPDGLGYDQATIDNIIKGEKTLTVPIHFVKNIDPWAINIDIGILEIPVTGIIDLKDGAYPDLWFSFDVARAYYYLQQRQWHPSYILQFQDNQEKPLLPLKIDIVKNAQGIQQFKVSGESQSHNGIIDDYLQLPADPRSVDIDIPYSRALLWIDNFKDARERDAVIRRVSESSMGAELAAYPLDYTLSKALNHISPIVKTFVETSIFILAALCIFTMLLFGLGYIHRKTRDIGLLRACGVNPRLIIKLYLSQIMALVIVGIIAGIVIAIPLSQLFEPWVNDMIKDLIPDSEKIDPTQIVRVQVTTNMINVITTATTVLLASFIGGLFPALHAGKIDPVKQLQSQF
ncbi:hypothetical protein PN36_20940 [Candidatus Thiomargarita nelsonii]|uniref:ABC3 transporter permease C-terminal domain-containing protein n=1 Tax=Candidatus Thiomargarita nelsonii TaxID=1003181 RepID=A0A0A6PQ33_9GAMM|nr:hypothetical protein PN36_20940 [Candidatus Thiomargarita nelsonii]